MSNKALLFPFFELFYPQSLHQANRKTNHLNQNFMTSIIAFIIAMLFGTANMNVNEVQKYDNTVKSYEEPSKGIGMGSTGGGVKP